MGILKDRAFSVAEVQSARTLGCNKIGMLEKQ